MATRRKEQKEKKDRYLVAIIILLVIATLWLLLSRFFGNPTINTTEKVQILDLAYCHTCSSNVPETGENDNWSAYENSENKEGQSAEKDENDGKIKIIDRNITWGLFSDINIFEDSLYDNRNLIAPGSTNTYKFIVRNRTGLTLDYDIYFEECNTYQINMKYRLISDGKYLAGDEENWVTFDKLYQAERNIKHSINDTYYLEWKWFDSDNDTSIGTTPGANYKLRINLKAKQDLNENQIGN